MKVQGHSVVFKPVQPLLSTESSELAPCEHFGAENIWYHTLSQYMQMIQIQLKM